MSKPSTDTATERQVAQYRKDSTIPERLTLRFLALLTKKELARLERFYDSRGKNAFLENVTREEAQRRIRGYEARYMRIQSERRLRGYIQ